MPSSPIMLQHFCTPSPAGAVAERCWGGSWPQQTDGQTDTPRSAPFLRALGAAGASRAIWLRFAVAADEVVGASRGCRSSHRAEGQEPGRRGGPKPGAGFCKVKTKRFCNTNHNRNPKN